MDRKLGGGAIPECAAADRDTMHPPEVGVQPHRICSLHSSLALVVDLMITTVFSKIKINFHVWMFVL